jgi:hypothetical protein
VRLLREAGDGSLLGACNPGRATLRSPPAPPDAPPAAAVQPGAGVGRAMRDVTKESPRHALLGVVPVPCAASRWTGFRCNADAVAVVEIADADARPLGVCEACRRELHASGFAPVVVADDEMAREREREIRADGAEYGLPPDYCARAALSWREGYVYCAIHAAEGGAS